MEMMTIIAVVVLLLTTLPGQAYAITQFYFDMPDYFDLVNGTVFRASHFDEDGEGTWFVWNYTGDKYDFSIGADQGFEHWVTERHNQTISVPPVTGHGFELYDYKFAINYNLTIGENMELCIETINFRQCEWPQPVDMFGRAMASYQ